MTIPSRSRDASVGVSPSAGMVVDEGLVAAARDVGSTISTHVDLTERTRRLAPPVIDALRTAGLFRLFTPRAFGSLEIDPVRSRVLSRRCRRSTAPPAGRFRPATPVHGGRPACHRKALLNSMRTDPI